MSHREIEISVKEKVPPTPQDALVAAAQMQALCVAAVITVTNERAAILPVLAGLANINYQPQTDDDRKTIKLACETLYALMTLISLSGPASAYAALGAVPVLNVPNDRNGKV